jgi:hypothetical protein
MSLKLSSLAEVAEKEEAGTWVDVLHPTRAPLCLGGQKEPFRIRMAGSYSRSYRNHIKQQQEALLRRVGAAEARSGALNTLVACTLEWANAFDDEGNVIPFTPENVRTVYETAEFIYDQAEAAVYNHAAFFDPPSAAQ